MRIGVTGPRDWTDRQTIQLAFYELYEVFDLPFTLVHGEATRGFDQLAKSVAVELRWFIEPYPVKSWYGIEGEYIPYAGNLRNQEMVDAGADYWIAGIMPCVKPCKRKKPHNTHGTTDCIQRVRKAGIPIRELEPYDEK